MLTLNFKLSKIIKENVNKGQIRGGRSFAGTTNHWVCKGRVLGARLRRVN